MQQGIVRGDLFQRIAGVSLILGAVLTTIFNIFYPRADDPSDVQQTMTAFGDNETFSRIVVLALAVGAWALMIGAVGVYRSISTGSAAAWVRLGFYGILVGTAVFTVSTAIGLAGADASADWIAADSKMGIPEYTIAATLSAVGTYILYMFIIVYWLALAFLGIGMVLGSVHPRWLSWPIIILGAVTLVLVGVPQALSDPGRAVDLIFAALAGLTTLWFLVLGVWITRKAW